MRITFLGGAGTVTGSKYLLEDGWGKALVDCGLYQGFKQLRLRNWSPLPADPKSIGAVILTHAHLDHSGYLPVLARNGFQGKIYSTAATRDLCEILLTDAGALQERDAEFANKKGFSKHAPALPLYTQAEAEACLPLFHTVDYGTSYKLPGGLAVKFFPAGHILGSAFAEVTTQGRRILFSGDIGRPNDPIVRERAPIRSADYLLVESTYGDRRHREADPEDDLERIIRETVAKGGAIVIPSFAVGRAQTVLYHLHRLRKAGRLPDIPVFLDSPMAVKATAILHNHRGENKLSAEECRDVCGIAKYVSSPDDSKAIDKRKGPQIIISASGMATGGRVLHHLKAFAPDPRNTILFAGFQAGGTRGAAMMAGAESVKIHGEYVPVKARIEMLDQLSAHADWAEILEWLKGFERPPKHTFITHGEPAASDALRHRIEEKFGWKCTVPDYRDTAELR
ncbi:MAG: MBL fold metallo-hydrolase [Bdellovibrionota bacterium]